MMMVIHQHHPADLIILREGDEKSCSKGGRLTCQAPRTCAPRKLGSPLLSPHSCMQCAPFCVLRCLVAPVPFDRCAAAYEPCGEFSALRCSHRQSCAPGERLLRGAHMCASSARGLVALLRAVPRSRLAQIQAERSRDGRERDEKPQQRAERAGSKRKWAGARQGD